MSRVEDCGGVDINCRLAGSMPTEGLNVDVNVDAGVGTEAGTVNIWLPRDGNVSSCWDVSI